MFRQAIFATLFALLATNAGAEIFKWVDADGNTHYSDDPPTEDAKPAELKPLPVMELDQIKMPARPRKEEGEEDNIYESLVITNPSNEATIRNYVEPLNVGVRVTPALKKGDAIRLRMDGSIVGSGTSGQFSIKAWDRGAHTLIAEVVNVESEVLLASAPVTFYVHRTSVLNPNHPDNKQKAP